MSQGKFVVSKPLRCSNKIITPDNWRSHNKWQMRYMSHSHSSWFSSVLWWAFVLTFCTFFHALEDFFVRLTQHGVFFNPITSGTWKWHRDTVWITELDTYKQNICQNLDRICPQQNCLLVYFYIISEEYVQILHRDMPFPLAWGKEHICGGLEALGKTNNTASVFLEMHIRNE